jgi:cell division protease FtsH
MVCEWGMSEKLGPLAYEKREGPVFLGMSQGHASKDYSEAKAEEIDTEISRIINTGYALAVKILDEDKEALERLTQALLEYETIDGHEVAMLVNGAAVSEIEKYRSNRQDGGGLGSNVTNATTIAPDGKKDPTGGPVGNSGPVTI